MSWKFWDIHAGHADAEHNHLVRREAVADLLREVEQEDAVDELARGYDFGTSMWDALSSTLYRDHSTRPRQRAGDDGGRPVDRVVDPQARRRAAGRSRATTGSARPPWPASA